MIHKHDCVIIFLYLSIAWLLGRVKNNQVENRTFLLVLRYSTVVLEILCEGNLSNSLLRLDFGGLF